MTPPLYRFYIAGMTGGYYYVWDGVVVLSAVYPIAGQQPNLRFSPMGWEDLRIGYKRDANLHGIFRSITTDFEFVEDGSQILRHIMRTMGVGARARFIIEQRQENWTYATLFDGELDFAKYRNSSNSVSIMAKEGGRVSKFYENKDVPFEISMGGAFSMQFDGFNYRESYNWYGANIPGAGLGVIANSEYFFPFGYVGEETIFQYLINPQSQSISVQPPNTSPGSTFGFISTALNISTTATITADITAYVLGPLTVPATFQLRLGRHEISTGTFLSTPLYTHPGLLGSATTTPISFSITPTIAIQTGFIYSLFWVFDDGSTSTTPCKVDIHSFSLGLAFDAKIPQTTAPAFTYLQAFKGIADAALGGTGTADSNLLQETAQVVDSAPAQLAILSGQSLRDTAGLPLPAFSTTLAEMFQDIQSRYAAGMGIDSAGLLRIERLETFFDAGTETAAVGKVKDFSESLALDYLANLLRIGYDDPDLKESNGRYITHTEWDWKLPQSQKTGEMNRIAPFISDPFSIERQRSFLFAKTTTDNSDDNRTFVVERDPTPVSGNYVPATAQTIATGIYDPVNTYNLSLTPKRNLLRLGRLLASLLWLVDDVAEITFQTTFKNKNLLSNLGFGDVSELANVVKVNLGSPLFLPVLQQFTTIAPLNLPALMAANPYGYISFTANGHERKGFIMEVSVKPGIESAFEWTLLAHPNSYIG